jgi:hypothetical protein
LTPELWGGDIMNFLSLLKQKVIKKIVAVGTMVPVTYSNLPFKDFVEFMFFLEAVWSLHV